MAINLPGMRIVHKNRSGNWLIIVGALPISFLMFFFIVPVVAIFIRGLESAKGKFSPLKIFEILTDSEFIGIACFTIGQAFASTLLTLICGMPIAWFLARVDMPGRFLFRIVITVPFVLPTVVVGIIFRVLLVPNGLFGGLGLDKTIWAILLAHVFFNVSIVARTVGGMWSHLDPRMVQAARILGASPMKAFCTVTLPALAPAIISAAAVVFLFCATSFGVILILGGTEYRTLETEIYLQTVNYFDLQTAAALSLLQLVTVILALSIAMKTRTNKENSVLRNASSSTVIKPRGIIWLPVVAVLMLIGLLLVLPPVLMIIKSLRDPSGQGWSLGAYQLLL
ncbi:MAG: ABC transporter permease, partial [Mycobacteriaceae bacterium]